MNTFSNFQLYKHDISGKFQGLSRFIDSMSETDFESTENVEKLHLVHESLLKMISTSLKCLEETLEASLIIDDKLPHKEKMEGLKIKDLEILFEIKDGVIKYHLMTVNLKEDLDTTIKYVCAYLPIKRVILRGENYVK